MLLLCFQALPPPLSALVVPSVTDVPCCNRESENVVMVSHNYRNDEYENRETDVGERRDGVKSSLVTTRNRDITIFER